MQKTLVIIWERICPRKRMLANAFRGVNGKCALALHIRGNGLQQSSRLSIIP